MKILYDHQTFTLQKYGGISRYFFELVKEFDKIKEIETNTSLFLSNNHYISDKDYIQHIKFLPNTEFRGKHRLITPFNKIRSIYELKHQNFDVFHPTYYDTYFLKYIKDKPFVLTVYDMIHEKFSDMFPINDKITQNKKLLCEKATKIIAISQSTKNDLIELFDIKESKIEVVYLGNSLILGNNISKDIILPTNYILFVGSRGSYKNFNGFIDGVSSILNNDEGLSVLCVGGGKFNNNEIKLFNSLKIENQVSQYNLDDDKLSYFYNNALLFVFPSLYEGFGIPILEAFACDCPLVCSDTSSLPEIAGNAAEYFNPYDSKSIFNAVKNVLNSSERQQVLKENGIDRLKLFSWERTAEETKKVYKSILK